MELFRAVQIVEGDIEYSEKEWVEAWQWLIDKVMCGNCKVGMVGML